MALPLPIFNRRATWASTLGLFLLLPHTGGPTGFAADSSDPAPNARTKPAPAPAPAALWSLQPLLDVHPPSALSAAERNWVRGPIDAFVAARLATAGLHPAPAADRATRLRRVHLDLVGLPPTPGQIAAFEADDSPDAWARVVDQLLASPQYGERWARHWLDLARYAESEGFKADETRPNAWRYRDYVIRALNADKPYDRFVQEQLAGDELWPDDLDARIATGFNRHYPDESNARNLAQRRQEILNDITDTTGAVFCGLTWACARCHDHKWDPISQVDYYRLQAFFANTAAADQMPLLAPDELAQQRVQRHDWEQRTREIRTEMARLEQPHRTNILKDYIDKYPEYIQVALQKSPAERNPFEQQMVAKAGLYLDPASHQYLASPNACLGRMKPADKSRWQELRRQLDAITPGYSESLPVATGLHDVESEPPATHVLKRGNYDAPLAEVSPGFLSVLNPAPTPIIPVAYELPEGRGRANDSLPRRSSGRRAALARLLTDPRNPLTARVIVNRVWAYHFGRGLVGTHSDFGLKGDAPTHPELLDWLTADFIRNGWSLKHLHRSILLSATYQTTATPSPELAGEIAARDPDNRWLSHFPRRRLDGETIRDAALFVAGRLNPQIGGPSIFPELPPGMETRGGWPVNAAPEARDRRSIYVFVRRNTRYPLFESFDMPDTHETCPQRSVTTSPVQALMLLNSEVTHQWAKSLANRVLETAGSADSAQIKTSWQLAYSRTPDGAETQAAQEFLTRQRNEIATRRQAGQPVVRLTSLPVGVSEDHAAALVDLCHALLNSNEFVYSN